MQSPPPTEVMPADGAAPRGKATLTARTALTDKVQHDLDLCMRCSACSATCPTYGVLGHEGFSPRGRVQLAAALLEGRLEPGSRALEFLDTCLHCEACRTACPNGVPVTGLVDLALDLPELKALAEPAPAAVGLLLWAVPRRWTMALLRAGIWFWQWSGLSDLARRHPAWLRLLGNLAQLEPALPQVPGPLLPPRRPPALRPAAAARPSDAPRVGADGGQGPRVAFFFGCIQEAVFAETNRASLGLLESAGAQLLEAPGQTCCGAMHLHQGKEAAARRLGRRNIEAFERSGADFVVNSAGGCGAMLRQYADLFADDSAWAERARVFSAGVRDISEFLVETGGPAAAPAPVQALPVATLPERIAVQDSCHLSHVQGVKSPLRRLLGPIAGGGLVELRRPDQCCGSAGVYNIEQPLLSMSILDKKMEDVAETGATVVATANPGCTLQMRLGVVRAGLQGRVRVEHVADLAWAALQQGESPGVGGASGGTPGTRATAAAASEFSLEDGGGRQG